MTEVTLLSPGATGKEGNLVPGHRAPRIVLLEQTDKHLGILFYRRQTDVGYCRKPKVDVVCVAEMQASCLKGRKERMVLQFSGFPMGGAQMPV